MNTPTTTTLSWLITALLLMCLPPARAAEPLPGPRVLHDLTPLQDATRVLINPHKGWYHHYPDNHINKYRIARDADLLEFPGMDHLYIRLAWSYLEPKEGQFDWAVIDRLIEKWTAHGLGIAFRISCKETSTDRIEQQFATPRWVMEAGAQGGYYKRGAGGGGPADPWEPVWDDPVFLAKLDKFLAAFAARYDGQPWLRYVDIGSIGDWGEGHTWGGSQKQLTFAVRKLHVDLYLKHFKHSQLIITDDFVYALKNPAERQALHQHVLSHGIGYRDDSIMVDGYFDGTIDEGFPPTSDTFTVRSPEFFADVYPRLPTVLELDHYGKVKSLGNWEGLPGSSVAKFGQGKQGPDFFRGALQLLHATYIGYHGDARAWLTDNPELTKELLNRCGYWLFPRSIEL
ncbi:MAG: beta-galactosidase, partial [Lacunisphaera sp.]|nr:beta-galactosidase [Lacunisphaera sp.]